MQFINQVNPNLTVANNTYYFPNINILSYIDSDWHYINENVFKNITGEKISGTHDQIWITFDEKDKGHIRKKKNRRKSYSEIRKCLYDIYRPYIPSTFPKKIKKNIKIIGLYAQK